MEDRHSHRSSSSSSSTSCCRCTWSCWFPRTRSSFFWLLLLLLFALGFTIQQQTVTAAYVYSFSSFVTSRNVPRLLLTKKKQELVPPPFLLPPLPHSKKDSTLSSLRHRHRPIATRLLPLRPAAATDDDDNVDSSNSDDDNNNSSSRQAIRSMAVPVSTWVGKTTTVLVSGTFFVVLAWKRDALMVSFFIGSIANGILSKILKKIINQTRPPELHQQDILKLKPSDNGMPSSHAMALGFISSFTGLHLPWTRIPLALYVVVSLYYRVHVRLHTWQQVLVGTIFGSMNGYGWFGLCQTDRNLWNISVEDFVTTNFLNEQGVLPLPLMVVPVLVGAATVGSFERRISAWLKKKRGKTSADENNKKD